MAHKTDVNIKIPNLEDLCCINCQVDPIEMQDPIVKSLFHCQVLTCRLIIYSVRCCIASPSIQNIGNLVHVIVSKKFYTTHVLQNHLSNLKLQFSDPEPVHPKIYEACLKYTITFKLAPTWNLVGKCLYLRGFNFLSLPIGVNGMEWRILPKDRDSKLEMKPMRINLTPLTLEFLSLSPAMINDFKSPNCTIDSIDLRLFESPWVYVLPNLSRAQLISVSKSLPENCPFQNYDDLRRHWKNMYSYRLPKTQQGMLFYEVALPSFPNQHFTYPEICILSKRPEILLCDRKNEITSEFLKDFTRSVHSLCGETLRISQPFPELKIEYSYTVKRSTDHSTQGKDDFTSPFFKTPNDYVVKPSGNKVKLSSLFTFKGIDKMSSTMKNHTQQVFSIMENQRQSGSSKNVKNTQALPGTFDSTLNPSQTKSSVTFEKSSPYKRHEKTLLDNMDHVLSFYDIPSMYPSSPQNLKSSSGIEINPLMKSQTGSSLTCSFPTEPTNFTSASQLPRKPIIKSIENVNFNLTRFENNSNNRGHSKSIQNQNLRRFNAKLQTSSISEDSNIKKYNLLSELEEDDEEFFPIYKSGKNGSKNLPSQFEYFRQKGIHDSQKGSQTARNNITSDDPLRNLLDSFEELKNVTKNNSDTDTMNDESVRKYSFDDLMRNSMKMSPREYTNEQNGENRSSRSSLLRLESQKLNLLSPEKSEAVGQSTIKENSITNYGVNRSFSGAFGKLKDDYHLTNSESKYVEKKIELSPNRVRPISDMSSDINIHRTKKTQNTVENDLVTNMLEKSVSGEKTCELSPFTWQSDDENYNNQLENDSLLDDREKLDKDNSSRIYHERSPYLANPNTEDVGPSSQNYTQNYDFVTSNHSNKKAGFQTLLSENSFNVNEGEAKDDVMQRCSFEQIVDKGDFTSILSQSSSESDSGDYESYKLAFKEALTFNNLNENIRMSR